MPRKDASRPVRAREVELEIDERPAALIALRERFAQFRAESERGARVLAALCQGVTRGALLRGCGIQGSQLDAWKRAVPRPSARSRRDAGEDVRVFAVVDDARSAGTGAAAADPPLELRVGPWSVTVRVAGSEPSHGGR